ncbi:MAG: hypothetical protein J7K38_02985 [Thermoplasmata archaeon]|nr:hypothetical protein [Thermoplasmata archaeon]
MKRIKRLHLLAISFLIIGTSLGGSITSLAGESKSHPCCEEKWVKFIHVEGKIEECHDVIQTRNGDYVLLIHSVNNYNYPDWCGDIRLVCLDREGSIKWDRTYGREKADIPWEIEQTHDGGFIIAGGTKSYGSGDGDVWLIKTDENGVEEWNKTYGGRYEDLALCVCQTEDGYILAGYTLSFSWEHYVPIGWVIKTDKNGNEMWNRTFGKRGIALHFRWVYQSKDGGYFIVGNLARLTHPNPNEWDITNVDICLIKLDGEGNEVWNKTLDYSEIDWVDGATSTIDGGIVIAGYTEEYSYPVMCIIKVDGDGNVEWKKTFKEGVHATWGFSVQQTMDGGFIVAGAKEEFDILTSLPMSYGWLIKLDKDMNEEWNHSYNVIGGFWNLIAPFRVKQTSDGGYILVGTLDMMFLEDLGFRMIGAIAVKTDSIGRTKDFQLKLCTFTYLYGFVKWFAHKLFHGRHSYKKSMPLQSHTRYSLILDRSMLPIHFSAMN